MIAPLDPCFIPPIIAFRRLCWPPDAPGSIKTTIAVERGRNFVSLQEVSFRIRNKGQQSDEERYVLIERMIKFLLWALGGTRIYFAGPEAFGQRLASEYSSGGTRAFDVGLMSEVFEIPFEFLTVRNVTDMPENMAYARHLGGHLEGCRIGFDLGASDLKVVAVKDGSVVFSEEIPWNPGVQTDPDYHYRVIMAGLKTASSHLPRLDAIGGSSAGIIIDNEVRASSLFRSVPKPVFQDKVKGMFLRLAGEWRIPFEVVNDGEVSALAGTMTLGEKSVLGLAMGSSLAAGHINRHGMLTGGLDELAFAPVDLSPKAPKDEWSGDRGVGANYFSQQAVDRLAGAAGIKFESSTSLPERLKNVQELAEAGDSRALSVFETIGIYLGYTIPWYGLFYDFRHMIVLGRVMSGKGGEIIITKAGEVLEKKFPDKAGAVRLHLLDEKSRRVGQAVAAASLPETVPMENRK